MPDPGPRSFRIADSDRAHRESGRSDSWIWAGAVVRGVDGVELLVTDPDTDLAPDRLSTVFSSGTLRVLVVPPPERLLEVAAAGAQVSGLIGAPTVIVRSAAAPTPELVTTAREFGVSVTWCYPAGQLAAGLALPAELLLCPGAADLAAVAAAGRLGHVHLAPEEITPEVVRALAGFTGVVGLEVRERPAADAVRAAVARLTA